MKMRLKKQDWLAVVRIVIIYAVLGTLWIYLSDTFLGLFTKDPSIITRIAIYKGIMFILFTSTLLYVLIARRVKIIVGSEKLLHRSEERFKQIAENAEEIIWEVNKDGLYTYVNPVIEIILGYKPEEIINKKYIYDLSGTDIKESVKREYENIFTERTILKGHVASFQDKEGREVILETNASPVVSTKGALVGYRGAHEDITKRKRTEAALLKSEATYRTLIETSPDAILMLNLNGEMVFVNDKAVKMHRYKSREEMIGANIHSLIPPEETSHIYKNLEKVITTGKSVYDEFIFIRNDGERFFAELNLSVILDAGDKPEAVIGIVKDISERKNNEIELEKYRLKLEDLVRERTKELEEVNQRLQEEISKQKEAEEKVKLALEKEKELNFLKSEFISTASHEFRTPLATILSSTELVERYQAKHDVGKILDHTERIKKAINYLTGLMEDVLTIGKAEAGKIFFDPKPTDLIKLCNVIIEEAKTLITDKQVIISRVEYEGPMINADEKLIKYILGNLLSNAIKFSSPEGEIIFTAGKINDHIEFVVSDNGIGIPEEDQKRIFDPFDRGSNIGVIRGSGLGMSIVKRSVDLHMGKIEFESKVNKGTKFVVTIPLIYC